ncbi:MAG: hypothetical protein IIX58_05220, partial [Alistipes sp.]|nr:hypothetical protein [Alistipes sp.]
MKLSSIKALLLVASLIIVASFDASLYAQRPRRGVDKRYTSPEEIQRRQDSINNRLKGDTTAYEAPTFVEEAKESRPTNRPMQIDSVLALWRASSSKEYYDKYFADFKGYSDAITASGTYDNTDSLYIARMQGIMTPVPL